MTYIDTALAENEKILILVRKHPIVLLPTLFWNLIFLGAVLVGAFLAAEMERELFAPLAAVGVFPICIFLLRYLQWHNEEYYITSHRVIGCEGILNKRMADSSLEKINDVVLDQTWLGRLLDYGNVEILTASDIGVNKLIMIRSPIRFKTTMLNQKAAIGQEDGHQPHYTGSSREETKSEAYELLSALDKLKDEGVLTEEEFQKKKTEVLARL